MNPATGQLWYDRPAAAWEEALPLGNGRIGAMVWGTPEVERLDLNEDTLWSGLPGATARPHGPEVLARARELIAERRFDETGILLKNQFLDLDDSASYVPAGTLECDFGPAGFEAYRRDLDFGSAVSHVEYRREDGTACRREAFISLPAQLLVLRFSGGADFRMRLSGPAGVCRVEEGDLVFDGACPWFDRYDRIAWHSPEGQGGIRYRMAARIVSDGLVEEGADFLAVSDAETVTVLLAIRSDFVDFQTLPGSGLETPAEACRRDLDRGELLGFEALLQEHLDDFTPLYRRSGLDLGWWPEDDRPSDRRLREAGEDFSPSLAALFWNYGRYLLLTASRPGTQPANLQGIWNRSLMPPWGCNYTTNINLEMNYWPAEAVNLPECAEPLFRFIREAAVNGRQTARDKYGLNGWCLHHNSDLWRYTLAASGDARWGFFPLAGAWLCSHLTEHYRYTLDCDFLKEYLPVVEEAARFADELLVTDPESGLLAVSPSTAPENTFRDPATGGEAPAAIGSAMDMALVRELFDAAVELAEAAGSAGEFHRHLAERRRFLRPDRIGSHGCLLEYGEEFEEVEIDHRHLSHLYGVYPGSEYTGGEYFEAVRRALLRRGDLSTGWAMCWRVALWARFGDGEHCRKVLAGLMRPLDPTSPEDYHHGGGTYPNFFDGHPPFQIDGNYGATAGICEMLLQSHKRNAAGEWIIELLPALPESWSEGEFHGWRARGAVTVDVSWRDGQLTGARLTADRGGRFEIRFNGMSRNVELSPGKTFSLF